MTVDIVTNEDLKQLRIQLFNDFVVLLEEFHQTSKNV